MNTIVCASSHLGLDPSPCLHFHKKKKNNHSWNNIFKILPKPSEIFFKLLFWVYFLSHIFVHLMETTQSFRLGFVVYSYLYPQVSSVVPDIYLKIHLYWWKNIKIPTADTFIYQYHLTTFAYICSFPLALHSAYAHSSHRPLPCSLSAITMLPTSKNESNQ